MTLRQLATTVTAAVIATVVSATPVAADQWHTPVAPVTVSPIVAPATVGQEHPAPAFGINTPDIAVPCLAAPIAP